MIRLDLPKEPYWLELGYGVRVKVRAPSTAIIGAMRAAGARRVEALRRDIAERRSAGVPLEGLPDLEDPDVTIGYSQLFLAQCLARAAIIEWEGVLAAEGDAPAPLTEQTTDDLMRVSALAEAFVGQYLGASNLVAAEGNASPAAPSGTSAAAAPTATSAGEPTPPAAEASAA